VPPVVKDVEVILVADVVEINGTMALVFITI